MKFIEFDQKKCDSCYKCLRTCPTKAISFNKDSRKVIDNLCIKCGLCQQSCPQGALKIRSNVEAVENLIAHGESVAVSIAPSFVGAFGLDQPEIMVGALKELGFSIVEETAVGAEMVAKEYDQYIEETEKDVIITSCCPSANYFIEQHFPFLIPSVIPVVSPMVAHGKTIKAHYGHETKVVFIGPCLAKIAEAEEMGEAIDEVLTFDELDQMIKAKGKRLYDYTPKTFDRTSHARGRAFPLGGSLKKDGKVTKDEKFRFFHVDGIEACKTMIDEIRIGSLKQCCIEMNICEGSCLNGPEMPKNYLGRFARELFMRNYVEKAKLGPVSELAKGIDEDEEETVKKVSLKREFQNKQDYQQEPNIEVIRQTMARMGKYTKEDELNCGACGYKTCYEKAKAVFLGYSDIDTCLPYLREKAESMQNTMIENSPNAVVVMNAVLEIIEVNPSFMRMFNQENLPVEEMPIKLFINHPIFQEVVDQGGSIHNQKIYVDDLERYYFINIVRMEDSDNLLAFLTDITQDEIHQKEFKKVKEETLQKTQEVIDKQMRVAQEIASLLGETTAETKMSLKSLNELVLIDRSDY